MQITKLNHLAKIEITKQNCEEIIAESLELMKQASRVQLMKMQSEARNRDLKRVRASKRELPVAVVRGK